MVPIDKVKEIIKKRLFGKRIVFWKHRCQTICKKSKEYSNLGGIVQIAKEFVNFENEKKDLQNMVEDKMNDQEIKDLAQKDLR